MSDITRQSQLIKSLLLIGATLDVDQLFALIVSEAPKLVGAEECSIFWKDGKWREPFRKKCPSLVADAIYRRATYEEKKHLVGVDAYAPGIGLTGWVVKHGTTLRIDDITNKGELRKIGKDLKWIDATKGYVKSPHKDRQKAFLAVPVMMQGEVLGVIRIAKTLLDNGTFSDENERLLEAFASQISALILHAEEAHQKTFWEELYLSGIGEHDDDFVNYIQKVADKIPANLGAQVCSIFVIDTGPLGSYLKLRATTTDGPLTGLVNDATYLFGEGLTGWVAKENRTLRLKDVTDEKELAAITPVPQHKGKHDEYHDAHSSFLACPVSIGDQVLGVVRVAQDSPGRSFTSADQRFLEYFCRNLAVLVKNWLLIRRLQHENRTAHSELEKRQKSLMQLRKQLFEDLASIRKDMSDLVPEVDTVGGLRIGPVLMESKTRDRNVVFVGIPFSASATNVFKFGIRPALERLGLKFWHGAEQLSQIDVMRKTFEGIQQCYLGIVDISDWNPNVLFELGVLYGQDHPVILLKREDAQVPADLAGLEYLRYGDFEVLAIDLAKRVHEVLSRTK